MTRQRPTQQRAQETRERILTAAAQLFAEHGIAGTSTNRIAQRAHISIGSLYRYYADKHEIADVLRGRMTTALEERFSAAVVASFAGSPEDSVTATLGGIVDALAEHRGLLRALATDATLDGTGLEETEKRLLMITRAYLLHQTGAQDDADLEARATVMVTVGLAITLRLGLMAPTGAERDRVIAETARMLSTWIAAS